MSDQSGLVAMPNTYNGDQVRAAFLEAMGKSRLRSWVRYTSGPQTLDGTKDDVWCAGTFTVNLPPVASLVDGDTYYFFQQTDTATLTIGRNGANIDGAAADATLVGAATVQRKSLTWHAADSTWRSWV